MVHLHHCLAVNHCDRGTALKVDDIVAGGHVGTPHTTSLTAIGGVQPIPWRLVLGGAPWSFAVAIRRHLWNAAELHLLRERSVVHGNRCEWPVSGIDRPLPISSIAFGTNTLPDGC